MPQDLRKAAILLMSLPDDLAAQLMSKLEPKQVEAVSIEIAKLGTVTGDEQETTIHEFAGANPSSMAMRAGGLEVAKSLVEKAMGKSAGRRWTTSASRSRPCPSASCRRSIIRTC